jgi:hypothetical protein
MVANGQAFWNHLTATRAHLGCVLGIDPCDTPTGPFCLVRSELHESTPGHIGDALVDDLVPVRLHVLNIERLKSHELIFVHQFAAFLMGEVIPPVGLALVGMLQRMNHLFSFRTALCELLFLALKAGNVFRILFHPALALDFLAIRKKRQRLSVQDRRPRLYPSLAAAEVPFHTRNTHTNFPPHLA